MRPNVPRLLAWTLWLEVAIGLGASSAHADQPRDWALGLKNPGSYANLDLIFPGYQVGVEHVHPIYGAANALTLRASSLLPLRFHEAQIDVELRLLVLTLGGSVGLHDDFRLLSFAPGESTDRDARAARESAGAWVHDRFPYYEGRLTLSLPLNRHVLLHNVNTFRSESRPHRSFDWRNGTMHDGEFLRSEFQLFIKHRNFGGLAPMLQALVFTLSGVQHTQLNYGFVFVTRPGVVQRDDIAFLQVLYHFGGALSPYDNRASYGGIRFLGPLTFIAAYRVVIDLGG